MPKAKKQVTPPKRALPKKKEVFQINFVPGVSTLEDVVAQLNEHYAK